MTLVTVREVWELSNAVCLPKRGLINVTISPLPQNCTVTNSTLFVIFSVPLSGEFTLTGVIDEVNLKSSQAPSLENELALLKNIGITHVSGFNDLSVSFDKSSPADKLVTEVEWALIPNTFNTFFAKLLQTSLGQNPTPQECDQFLVFDKVSGQNYNSASPLVPLLLTGSNVFVASWDYIGGCDFVSLPDNSNSSTLQCYPRGSEVQVDATLTPGANYYWVDDSFTLVTEPLPVLTTKTYWVGTAISTNTLNVVLSLLFED